MKFEKFIRSKMVCLSIICCYCSWAVYLNFYGNSKLINSLSFIPSLAMNIGYNISDISVKTFSDMNNNYPNIETTAFILSLLLCITTALIISSFIHILIKKILIKKNSY